MAIYHLHVKNISRGDGRSAVAAAAYRSGQTLPNEAEEGESRFGGRRDVVHAEIVLPDGAPAWMADRAQLWNVAEGAERRKDARLAKEIEFALPRELPPALWLDVARSMAAVYIARGHAVDLAIHDDGSGHNPHVHLMLTTRAIMPTGFAGKLRDADALKFVTEARAAWAQIANAALAGSGSAAEIDPRSNAAAGIARRAGEHRGPDKFERQARRARRDAMADEAIRLPPEETRAGDSIADDPRYPVPDPDGRPISPAELTEAETAMLAEMEQPDSDQPSAELDGSADNQAGAVAAVEAINAAPMTDDEASAYRLSPPDRDWWKSTRSAAPVLCPQEQKDAAGRDWWKRTTDAEPEQSDEQQPDRWQR